MAPTRDSYRSNSSNSDRYSMASNEGSQSTSHSAMYLLEHLATFSVSTENDLVYPADGMRRLLAMEKTNGIWTQKMLLKLERKNVIIMDHENKDVVERFPIGFVREPTAFTSTDPKEMYNNILIIIVGHEPEESSSPSEMHIFQCVNVRARDIVEDLKALISGIRRRSETNHLHDHNDSDHDVKVDDLAPNYGETSSGRPSTRIHANMSRDESNSSVSSSNTDKYEKDVTILNRCFDDIEMFIARLQHAAAAFRELEKRRRSRKTKKKDLGDGMLSMRAKAPPEREFLDIFAKFKLSFNLLAKLKAHIHDPNAPELIHFLFTPLALIVDASHDSHYGPNLPSKVIAPLLSSSSIELLNNCLTSKESELWHSLGEPWYVPSSEWKSHLSPYKPVFMDGWTPSSLRSRRTTRVEDHDEVDHDNHEVDHDEVEEDNNSYRRYGESIFENGDESISNNSHHLRVSPSHDSNFETQQRKWLHELMSNGAKVVQVTYPRTANNEKELTVVRGEYLQVLDDSRKWWKARNIHGIVAHVPHTIVSPEKELQVPVKSSGPGSSSNSEWIQRERRGRKGEFRYF